MWRIKGACSNLSSKKLKNCLKTNDDAKTPIRAIKLKVTIKPKAVFKYVLVLKPIKENSPAKKSNSFERIASVIINGINKIKPCIKYFKNCFIVLIGSKFIV